MEKRREGDKECVWGWGTVILKREVRKSLTGR